MRVLVTGAAGFVGRHLVPVLANGGHNVYAVVRNNDQFVPTRNVDVIQCDLGRPLDTSTLPEADAIVHLAQANVAFPDHANEMYRVNTLSTQELLDYSRRVLSKYFVYASSGAVYGFGDRPFRETDELVPHNFYAITKISGEQLVSAYKPYLNTTILRFFFPYGPGQRGRLIPDLIGYVREGRPVILNGNGRPRINPVYIDDVVRMIQCSLTLIGHHVLNVAGDEVQDIRQLAELIRNVVGHEPRFEQGSCESPGDLIGDNRLMHELFNASPLVPLCEGLRRTAENH